MTLWGAYQLASKRRAAVRVRFSDGQERRVAPKLNSLGLVVIREDDGHEIAVLPHQAMGETVERV